MKILVLGAGISGHTAALILRRKLGKAHEVTVVSPKSKWNWIPSNIWVGVGQMPVEAVTFELAPVYARLGIRFVQGKAVRIRPEGSSSESRPHVIATSTRAEDEGAEIALDYDFLINATGPRLKFEATPGLGPEGFSHSVCTSEHADQTAKALAKSIAAMKAGERKTFLVGTGHGLCTCEGAAFEYVFNLEFELRRHKVRDLARIVFITNEADLGDFGVDGLYLKIQGGYAPSKIFAESLFVERGVEWVTGAHVHRVERDKVVYETLDGEISELEFDFAMLLPPFGGVPLTAMDREGNDITSKLFNPNGFMKVDANYSEKSYDQWEPADWPTSYQTCYSNIFAIGIAFAPPHPISKPQRTKNGVLVSPAPPRTGMPSAIMGRAVANSIVDMVKGRANQPTHGASMAHLGAACVASAGANVLKGAAASITMYPIIPDYSKYGVYGRHQSYTTGEMGLAGHWIKNLLHHAFLYKAKAYPFWWIIPE